MSLDRRVVLDYNYVKMKLQTSTKEKPIDPDRLLKAVFIDKHSFVPLYRQIADAIRLAIVKGYLKPGELLPSEQEIAGTLGVAKMTVRQALLELKREGLVYRHRGVGTFIAFPKFEHRLGSLVSFTEDIRSRGMVPSSRILFFGHVPSDEMVAARFGIEKGEPVLRIYRVRFANNQPVGIHEAYLPGDIPISKNELETEESLYALLEDKGFQLVEAEESIEAVPADPTQSELLGLNVGDPLLKVVRTVFTTDRRPVEYVIAIYRSDLYRYSTRLRREPFGRGEKC